VDNAGRAGDALPWAKALCDAISALVLDEHVEMALQDEEDLLDFMGMRRISLTRRNKHD